MKRLRIRENAIYISLLLLTGISVYYTVLGHQFLTFWDDQWVTMNTYTEGGVGIRNLWAILTEFYHGQYAPINEYFYLTLYTISGGYNPVAFHTASLLVHLANIIWVYVLLRKILLRATRLSQQDVGRLSFLTALIFGIHPFNVESVAWISASKILLYAFFYFCATYTLLLYMESGKKRHYVYTLLLFIVSFLGKEQAVTFPVWMLLLYWIVGRDLRTKKTILEILPFFLLALSFGILTICSQMVTGYGDFSAEVTYPLWQRAIYACYTFVEYLLKCILPIKLSYLYPFPSLPGDPLPDWLLVYPVLLLVIGYTLRKYLLRSPALPCLLFFLIHIGVALHLISLSRFAVVADRYVYVSSIAVAFGVAYGCLHLYKRVRQRARWLVLIGLLSYLLALGIYANIRTHVWHDTDTLKMEIRSLLKQRPDYEGGQER